MDYSISYSTNVGTEKENNEDSFCFDEAETDNGKIFQAVICDGMGGLDRGEVASAAAVKAFSNWFANTLPGLLCFDDVKEKIKISWNRLIKTINNDIYELGRKKHSQLGTTLTAIIFLENGEYVIAHVGDTRAYKITDKDISVITEDQTLVAYKIRNGTLTVEKAKTHPQRNVLLQCVGATLNVEPEFYFGKANKNDNYLLCSDGFRHEITNQEIFDVVKPSNFNIEDGNKKIDELINLVMSRGEKDNITSLVIQVL